MNLLLRNKTLPSMIVSDPSVMSGDPVIRGTRVTAETIMIYLQTGYSDKDIFQDYPTLPLDAIDVVKEWATENFGSEWQNRVETTTTP